MVTLEDIKKAGGKLTGVTSVTPVIYSDTISEIIGTNAFFKLENLQKTGSFKVRGAYNKISSLNEKEREKGVIAVSAGNHAQGVAYAASMFGMKATVVMPESVPKNKVEATKGYGADVIIHGKSIEESKRFAIEKNIKEGQIFIHPYDEPLVIAGQGTVGAEMLEEIPDLDTIIVPVGGGGLISGIAIAAKNIKPAIRIVGVEIEGYESVKLSINQGKIVQVPGTKTIADGIAINTCGELTYKIIKKYVDNIIVVSEEDVKEGVLILLDKAKVLAEGAGAVGLSAFLSGRLKIDTREKVGIVISGGNIDLQNLKMVIE